MTNKLRCIQTIAGTVLVMMILAGCSSSDSSEPSQVSDISASDTDNGTSNTDGLSTEQLDFAFLSTVRKLAPHYASTPDEVIIGMGHNVCGYFFQGYTFLQIVDAVNGSHPLEAASLVGAAVPVYCPEYRPLLSQ